MNFNNSIILDTYSNNANKQFDDMHSRLSEIENSFQTRMNGKTTGGLVGSLIGTIAWLAAFIVGAVFARNMVDGTLLLIAMAIAGGLILFMLIDNIMDFSYYGKIASYKNSISQLQNRVSIGKNSIQSNHDAFLASRAKGWNYLLSAAPSIPEEAASVEATMTSMESLKKGFISGAKNIFFYSTVIAVTVVGCIALFPISSGIINGFIEGLSSDTELITISTISSSDTLMTINIIALIITSLGEIMLAKLVWSKTDCNVTNTTLLIAVLGPIVFLALICAAMLLFVLVVWIIDIVLYILGVVVIGAVIFAASSGG